MSSVQQPKPAFALLAVAAAIGMTGCFGSDRSAAAVCKVWDTDGKALHAQLENEANSASGNPLGELANLAGTPERVANLMGEMASVAPSNVEPAFQHLAEAFHQIAQSEGSSGGDPLAGLVGGLGSALAVQGDAQTVNDFLAQNCGIPNGG